LTDKTEWQGRVGQSWAAEWRRTDRSFTGLTDVLLGRASAGPFRRALDVGCGAGELSLALARGHAGAEIVGIDVSTELVEVARGRGAHLGNVAFHQADAAEWRDDAFVPDLVVSRHGVMFFGDPVAAFAHLGTVAAPGARLVFSCFREPGDNPWASRPVSLLPNGSAAVPADLHAPGPFAFADPHRVEHLLREAGWADVHCEPADFAFVLGMGEDAIEDALSYMLAIGPAARAARDLSGPDRADFAGRLRSLLAGHAEQGLVAMRAGAWIVTARAGR
jgi:SAM-dependent methyltransferase